MPVNSDRSVGWTKRSAAVTVLLAMEEHRKRAGLRLVQLRFENGRHDGRRSTLRQLAEALGVDEADIVGDPPAPLGLGDNGSGDQLDRIERLLVELSGRLAQLEELVATRELKDAAQQIETGAPREQQQPGRRAAGSDAS
jgi:transcriptional regulator with XRE-family HTH domain